MHPDRVAQAVHLDGFAEVVVHAGLEASVSVGRRGARREGHNNGLWKIGPAANGRGGLETTHQRHVEVHQNDVVRRMRQRIQHLHPVHGEIGWIPDSVEHAKGYFLVDFVVFRKQNPWER